MSQSSSLDSSFEENVNKNKELENLFIKFSVEIDHHEKSKILYSLVEAYILLFKDELETNIKAAEFFQLLPQVPLLCEKFLQIPNSSSIDEIGNKTKNLESASLSFDALFLCVEAFTMTNQCVALIKIALNILSQGYSHCKESEIIYGDLLEQFADQLGIFFKKIENLQTIVLKHLDTLDMTKYAEDDLQINVIVVEMGNLCQIVFSLDADVAFELWMKYRRIITEHKALKHISNINDISIYLASKNIEVLQAVKYSLDKDSEEDEELAAKFFFYLDALSDLLKLVHDSFKENLPLFITFVSNLLDSLILCYSSFITEKPSMNIIRSSLTKNTFMLLSHLCADEEFLKSVLLTPCDKENHLCIILLKLCSLQFVERTLQFRENFLREIFSDFLSNSAGDDMKLLHCSVPRCSVTKTKSEELVTLYQLAYEIITESLKLIPDSLIENLESTILNSVVKSSDVIYLLISDVWIYRLRCSTIDFLKEHCYAVLENLHKEHINNDKIENLVKRMLRFLPVSYKDALLETFSSINFNKDNKSIQHRFGIPNHISTENEINTNSEEQIKKMMSELSENSSNDALSLVKKACICLELCTFFINVAGCSEILQFLELASELFKTDVYEIQIATLTFLKCLSKKNMVEHNQEFGRIVTVLAQLFSETMHSKNYIVKYEARNIFNYFAKCTKHIQIVQETVKKDPTLKSILKSYMNAVPENNFLSEKQKAEYFHKQILMARNFKFEIPPKAIESLQQLFSRTDIRFLM